METIMPSRQPSSSLTRRPPLITGSITALLTTITPSPPHHTHIVNETCEIVLWGRKKGGGGWERRGGREGGREEREVARMSPVGWPLSQNRGASTMATTSTELRGREVGIREKRERTVWL